MPAALPIALVSMSVGLSAFGKYQQGQAEDVAYKYNARLLESDAITTREKAEYEAEKSKVETKRLIGEQTIRYAKAGVDISSGSPLMVLAATAAEGKEEEQMIRYTGDVEATKLRNQARMQRYYGSQAKKVGTLGALSTVLGSAGIMYGMSGVGSAATGGAAPRVAGR